MTTIDVPNPVRWQVVSNADSTPLKDLIRNANSRLNVQKMKCYAAQITYLVDHIVAAYIEPNGQSEMLLHAASLAAVAEDLARRMRDTGFAHAGELATSLAALCERLARADRHARQAEIDILPTLARAIQKIFDEDPNFCLGWIPSRLFKDDT